MGSIARQSILYRLRRDIPEPAGGTLICRTEKTMKILGDALVRVLLETAPEAAMRTTALGG